MHQFKKVFLIVLCVLAFIVLIQNTQVAKFQLLFWSMSMSRALFYAILIGLGFILGWMTKHISKQTK